jgi:hypothetical protein
MIEWHHHPETPSSCEYWTGWRNGKQEQRFHCGLIRKPDMWTTTGLNGLTFPKETTPEEAMATIVTLNRLENSQ